ncbi:hypothetical protein CPC08DRAFT_728169 [Agrocybe pediades]|nr:hypothetical protein CPC08DRAFT_728169 [Agrocybe pediades]
MIVEEQHLSPCDGAESLELSPSVLSSSALSVVVEHTASLEFLNGQAVRFGFRSSSFLLNALQESSSIISGSLALAVMHPGAFIPGDMDLYVAHRDKAAILAILQSIGYKHIENSSPPYYAFGPSSSVLESVLTFERCVDAVTPITTVNVVCVRDGYHVLRAVVGFHSTLVMNFISWYGLVCLYPHLTVMKEGLMVISTPKTRECFQKYRGRGFVLYADGLRFVRHLQDRSMDDGDVLVVPFVGRESSDILREFVGPFVWSLESYVCSSATVKGDHFNKMNNCF